MSKLTLAGRLVAVIALALTRVPTLLADDVPPPARQKLFTIQLWDGIQLDIGEKQAPKEKEAAKEKEPAKEKAEDTAKNKPKDKEAAKEEPKKEKAKAPVRRQVIAPAPVLDAGVLNGRGQANEDAVMQQWLQQFRPTLVNELDFIRVTCEVPKEHRPKIKKAGEDTLRESVKQIAKGQNGGGARWHVNGLEMSVNAPLQVREAIAKGIEPALREAISPEEMAEYQKECAARSEHRKHAAILCAVTRLDAALFLTTEQRDAIVDSLHKGWKPEWEQWIGLSSYDAVYQAMIPDNHLIGHLNEKQRTVWNGLQKVQPGIHNRGVQNQDDGWWDNAPPKQPAQAPVPAGGLLVPFQRLLGLDR